MTVTLFLLTSTSVIFWELMKEVGVRFFKSEAPKAVVAGLQVLDYIYPHAIKEGWTPEQLEDHVRAKLGHLSGSEWVDIKKEYDPSITLEKIKDAEGN